MWDQQSDQNNVLDNDRLKVIINQSRLNLIRQVVNHMWRNSDTSLLPKVRAVDFVWWNN